MSKFSFKKILLTGATYVATVAIAIGSTLALLQDNDLTINVMATGIVDIDHVILERDGEGLKEFTQLAPLYPAVFPTGDQGLTETLSWDSIGAPGKNTIHSTSIRNVRDMFTFVQNTSGTEAYVRAWFAFEQGDLTKEEFEDLIVINRDDEHWSWSDPEYGVRIDGNPYVVVCATYLGAKDNDCVLPKNTISHPSLLQIYMASKATNRDCAAVDGNDSGKYDVLFCFQAVQTMGFQSTDPQTATTPLESAENALNTAFPNNPWEDMIWPAYQYAAPGDHLE